MSKSLTSEEKLQLRNKAKQECLCLEKVYADKATMEVVEKFKNTFSICEAIYKTVLLEQQKTLHGVKAKRMEQLKITMSQVPSALRFAGYTFDNALLQRLFGSQEKRGQKSAKKVRDEMTHHINTAAINELTMRGQELFADMETFINTVRSFDNPQQA